MTTINDVIHIDKKPAHYQTLYPFSITLHIPNSYPLTAAEQSVINDAIVNAAAKIRLMRGHGEYNFAWCEGHKIHWEQEGEQKP